MSDEPLIGGIVTIPSNPTAQDIGSNAPPTEQGPTLESIKGAAKRKIVTKGKPLPKMTTGITKRMKSIPRECKMRR